MFSFTSQQNSKDQPETNQTNMRGEYPKVFINLILVLACLGDFIPIFILCVHERNDVIYDMITSYVIRGRSSIMRSAEGGGGGFQKITFDHKGGGGVN